MPRSSSRLERVYFTKEANYGTIVAPTGASAVRNIKLALEEDIALLRRRDKTGTRSGVAGVRGRSDGKWSFEASLVGSGTAGTPHDILFQLLFGAAPAAGVYSLSDTILSGNLWSYRQPSTIEQRVARGAVLQNFEFTLGQDVAEFRCDGEHANLVTSANFAALPTAGKGGLGSVPAEPGTPVYTDAGLIAGFTGAITIDAQTVATIRQATIKGSTGNELIKDTFNSYYATGTQGGVRNFTFSFNAYDDDSAGIADLKAAATSKAQVNATVQIGSIAGSICTFQINGIQLASPTMDDSGLSYVVTFPDSPFVGTDPTLRDELTMTWS
jgi:hypothetical protein